MPKIIWLYICIYQKILVTLQKFLPLFKWINFKLFLKSLLVSGLYFCENVWRFGNNFLPLQANS